MGGWWEGRAVTVMDSLLARREVSFVEGGREPLMILRNCSGVKAGSKERASLLSGGDDPSTQCDVDSIRSPPTPKTAHFTPFTFINIKLIKTRPL